MKKLDLEARRQQLSSVSSDSENDFDEIVSSARSLNDTAKITIIPLERLVEYSDEAFESITGRPQPFKTHCQESLESLAKSIEENGVINPIVVRPLEDGKYQILAGRNRARASRICGNTDIPAIVRADIDDIGAAMIMLDTNLEQRPSLSYSEKAFAYKMRIELQSCQGKRTDLDGNGKKDSLSEVGKENKDSRRMVAYLIRLTYLNTNLLDMVDEGELGFKLGVAISYLTPNTQFLLFKEIIEKGIKVKQTQIKEIKILDECGSVTVGALNNIFLKIPKDKPLSITIKTNTLEEFSDILSDTAEIERLFLEFLRSYSSSLQKGREV